MNTSYKDTKFSEMKQLLKHFNSFDHIRLTMEGKTVENRDLFLVHISHPHASSRWKIFFCAQQHGNEPAGKEALLQLIKQLSINPKLLPSGIELWIMPMINPDGAEANERRNANNMDLNRDHQLLSQPETQTLHCVVRTIEPHIATDCHEYTCDSEPYMERGWYQPALITMDTANNPLFGSQIYEIGKKWIDEAAKIMEKAGILFTRYYVGGPPPENEIRHSNLEVDDGRNGFGSYGALAFIIESGVFRNSNEPDSNFSQRVNAYLTLLWFLIKNAKKRQKDLKAIEHTRTTPLPSFIPTNYFWGSAETKEHIVKMAEKETGTIKEIKTPNFFTERIIKKTIPTPMGYVIPPEYSSPFKNLFEKHEISYKTLKSTETMAVQPARLIRVENNFDSTYNRYKGRQIVKTEPLQQKEFPEDSVYIHLTNTIESRRAIVLLEPNLLYGLYRYDEFYDLTKKHNQIPVFRVINR
ncbi:MAG: M14 family zinc carboxypeptidase [Promethearchaeota archaeon]